MSLVRLRWSVPASWYDALDGIRRLGRDELSRAAAAVAWLVSRRSLQRLKRIVY